MKDYAGILTLVLGLASYGLYIRDVLRNHTKPHALSWLIWSVLSTEIFFTQQSAGAGAGSWITGLTAVATFIIFVLAIRQGHQNITRLDWFCLFAAAISLTILATSGSHIIAVVIASATFVIGLIPTVLKSYARPNQETASTFFLNGLKFVIAIAALGSMSFVNILYPLTLIFVNWMLVAIILIRRRSIV